MTDLDLSLAFVEVAQQSMKDAADRRSAAQQAVAEFALRALLAGHPVERIMEAAGFQVEAPEDPDDPGEFVGGGLFGFTVERPSSREQFAEVLAREVRRLVVKGP